MCVIQSVPRKTFLPPVAAGSNRGLFLISCEKKNSRKREREGEKVRPTYTQRDEASEDGNINKTVKCRTWGLGLGFGMVIRTVCRN